MQLEAGISGAGLSDWSELGLNHREEFTLHPLSSWEWVRPRGAGRRRQSGACAIEEAAVSRARFLMVTSSDPRFNGASADLLPHIQKQSAIFKALKTCYAPLNLKSGEGRMWNIQEEVNSVDGAGKPGML